MIKILFGTAAVAMVVAGSYALLAANARKTAADAEAAAAAASERHEDEWQVEYFDRDNNPIKPANVESAPATGFQWKSPSSSASGRAPASGKPSSRSKSDSAWGFGLNKGG
jgi:hypothetical protein